MCDPVVIERLYANVLYDDIARLKLTTNDIRTGISNMKEVYKPDTNSLSSSTLDVANYNDAAHRCAYLHKYAPLHTALVANMLDQVIVHCVKCFKDLLAKNGCFNICSLGGGPGCDVVAALAVLHEAFGFFSVNATIVDIMIGWRQTFNSIIQELRFGEYGLLGDYVSDQYLKWSYEEANLIGKMTNGVNKAIGSAHLITMVKFVSASSCQESSAMIGKIFRTMKQGALVLYIDNAGGGFHQMVRKEAQACNLITVFGPLKHEHYENRVFDVKRFGYTPCLETKVTVHVWRKPLRGGNDNWSLENVAHSESGYTNFPDNVVPRLYGINASAEWGSEPVDQQISNTASHPRSRERSRSRSRARSRSNQRKPVQNQPAPSTQSRCQLSLVTEPRYQPATATQPRNQPAPVTQPRYQPAPVTQPRYQPSPITQARYQPTPATQPIHVTQPRYQPAAATQARYQPTPVVAQPRYQPAPVNQHQPVYSNSNTEDSCCSSCVIS